MEIRRCEKPEDAVFNRKRSTSASDMKQKYNMEENMSEDDGKIFSKSYAKLLIFLI